MSPLFTSTTGEPIHGRGALRSLTFLARRKLADSAAIFCPKRPPRLLGEVRAAKMGLRRARLGVRGRKPNRRKEGDHALEISRGWGGGTGGGCGRAVVLLVRPPRAGG